MLQEGIIKTEFESILLKLAVEQAFTTLYLLYNRF